jgi:hypothetical protein
LSTRRRPPTLSEAGAKRLVLEQPKVARWLSTLATAVVVLTFSAEHFAFDLLAKLSPLEATFLPLSSMSLQRYVPAVSW